MNDETFGSAINGDWETAHESLVRLTGSLGDSTDVLDNGAEGESIHRRIVDDKLDKPFVRPIGVGNIGDRLGTHGSNTKKPPKSYRDQLMDDSDLELEFGHLKIDDVDLKFNDSAGRLLGGASINLNAGGVWSTNPLASSRSDGGDGQRHPVSLFNDSTLSQPQQLSTRAECERASNDPSHFLREHFSTPFGQNPMSPKTENLQQGARMLDAAHPLLSKEMKMENICRLEDIERGLLKQHNLNPTNDPSEVDSQQDNPPLGASNESQGSAKSLTEDIEKLRINDSKPSTPSIQQRTHPSMPPQMYLNQPQCSTIIRPCVINTQTGKNEYAIK